MPIPQRMGPVDDSPPDLSTSIPRRMLRAQPPPMGAMVNPIPSSTLEQPPTPILQNRIGAPGQVPALDAPLDLANLSPHRFSETARMESQPSLSRVSDVGGFGLSNSVARVGGVGLPENEATVPVISTRYGEAQRAVNPAMPEVTPLRDHSTDKKRGWVGNLLHRLEHVGKGALQGSRFGLAGAITGAIGGGVNPAFADRMERTLVEKPQVYAERERIGQEANDALQRAGQYERVTGINPYTGMESPDTAMKRENVQSSIYNRTAGQQANVARLSQDVDEEDRQAIELWAEKNPGQPVPASQIKGQRYRDWIGKTPPRKPTPERHIFKTGPGGVEHRFNVDTSKWEPTSTASGEPMAAPVKPEKPDKPDRVSATEAYKEAEFEYDARQGDVVAERTARIDKLLPSYINDIRDKAAKGDAEAERLRISLETEAAKTVDMAMKQKRETAVSKRASEILRESQTARATPQRTARATPQRMGSTNNMAADEAEYQQLYSRLSPQQRQALESEFEKDYGRKPHIK